MALWQIILLACVQGAAELLPVSSSAHVIAASVLLGLDPASPEMTFLLVMLHTGTMGAAILYFWRRWRSMLEAGSVRKAFLRALILATGCTGVLGLALKKLIEKTLSAGAPGAHEAEIEQLFGNLPLVAGALLAAGLLIA